MGILSSIARAGRIFLSHARVTMIMNLAQRMIEASMLRHNFEETDKLAEAHKKLSLSLMKTYIETGEAYLKHETGDNSDTLSVPDLKNLSEEEIVELKKEVSKVLSLADKTIAALKKENQDV